MQRQRQMNTSFLDMLPCWGRRISCMHCHGRSNLGWLIWTRIQKTIHGMVTHFLSCQEKVQVSTLCQKTYAGIVLGHDWTSSRTLSGERRDSQQCKVQHHAGRETEVCNLHSSSWTLSKGVLLLHDNARPHTSAATVTTIQKVKFKTINPPPTVQTLPHLTIMCLARLRKHCNDEDFTATTRWRRQCISDFDNNKKLFFYWNSELYLSILLHSYI
jgi:hypothetical protein